MQVEISNTPSKEDISNLSYSTFQNQLHVIYYKCACETAILQVVTYNLERRIAPLFYSYHCSLFYTERIHVKK